MKQIANITVRYAETDRMGIAHHANYLIWYEQARTEFTKAMGSSYAAIERQGLLSPLLGIETRYLLPCTYEDELEVVCWPTRVSPAQMEFAYEVRKGGQVINTGASRHAWVDKETFRPVSLKKRLPELYAALQNAVEKPE